MTNDILIAYCGLYCGDCFFHKGCIADLARDLRKELRAYKFDRFAQSMAESSPFFKKFQNYPICYELLGEMVRFRCKNGCRQGGGNPSCKIRTCCQKKRLEGCWLCGEFETCDKFEMLIKIHADANLKNLKILKNRGQEAFIKGKRNW